MAEAATRSVGCGNYAPAEITADTTPNRISRAKVRSLAAMSMSQAATRPRPPARPLPPPEQPPACGGARWLQDRVSEAGSSLTLAVGGRLLQISPAQKTEPLWVRTMVLTSSSSWARPAHETTRPRLGHTDQAPAALRVLLELGHGRGSPSPSIVSCRQRTAGARRRGPMCPRPPAAAADQRAASRCCTPEGARGGLIGIRSLPMCCAGTTWAPR